MTKARTIDFSIEQSVHRNEIRMEAVSAKGREYIDCYRGQLPFKNESDGVMTFPYDYRDKMIWEMFDHNMAVELSF